MRGQQAISDRDLGECVVFGGSRSYIAFFALSGLLFTLFFGWSVAEAASGSSKSDASWIAAPAFLAFFSWASAAWLWRTQLVIGERGFRYVRPFRRVELPWRAVSASKAGLPSTIANLAVWFRDDERGRAVEVRMSSKFSTSDFEICRVMNARWAAATGHDPGGPSDPWLEPVSRVRPRRR